MAFSKKQYENFVRTIIVAAVAKEFRKAKIIENAVKRALEDGKIATGGLAKPSFTGSMIPSRDDRWLLDRESVIVSVGKVEQGLPRNIDVTLNIKFGVDGDYVFTRSDVDANYPSSFPNVGAIKTWIQAKSDRGLMTFTYRNKTADLSNPKVLDRIAYAVGKSIKTQGIKDKYKSNYFEQVSSEADAVLNAALAKASSRVMEKYEEEFYNSITNILDTNIL